MNDFRRFLIAFQHFFLKQNRERSPGSSSSSSDWSVSPLPAIDQKSQTLTDNPDRLMGAPVVPRLPSILKNPPTGRFR